MCKLTAAQVAADGQIVGNALDNLAEALPAGESTIATDLETAGKAIEAATSNWQEGSPTADLEDAEGVVITALDLFPLTSPFASAVAVVFAGVNLLMANTKTQAEQQATQIGGIAAAHALLSHAQASNTQSQWHGVAKIQHHRGNDPRADLAQAFNEAAVPLGIKPVTL
jgi:hypothetical protein